MQVKEMACHEGSEIEFITEVGNTHFTTEW